MVVASLFELTSLKIEIINSFVFRSSTGQIILGIAIDLYLVCTLSTFNCLTINILYYWYKKGALIFLAL